MSNVAIVIQANIYSSAPGSLDCFICGESVMAELIKTVDALSDVQVIREHGIHRVEEFMGVPVVLSRHAQRTRLEAVHRNPIGEIEIQVLRW